MFPGMESAWWWAACEAARVGERPLARRVLGRDVVLWRAPNGALSALEDRCPHRNAPLSAGSVRGGALECGYHGWRFGPSGRCVSVPGPEAVPRGARDARAFHAREQDGLAWIGLGTSPPARAPEPADDRPESREWTEVRLERVFEAPLERVLENVLDVAHTAFLHGGLFRSRDDRGARGAAVVTASADRAVADYGSSPRPSGLAGRLLAPRARAVTHVDRFVMPSIAQVDYGLGEGRGLRIHHVLTPVDASRTRVFFLVRFRLGLPAIVARPLVRALASRLVGQDAGMLALQSRTIERHGGESFASTEADVLGGAIRSLLRGGAG
jgi:phenylpropionate dioxygenase-like ring-hydroxylating dioxygenase large terminal subunit